MEQLRRLASDNLGQQTMEQRMQTALRNQRRFLKRRKEAKSDAWLPIKIYCNRRIVQYEVWIYYEELQAVCAHSAESGGDSCVQSGRAVQGLSPCPSRLCLLASGWQLPEDGHGGD